MADNQIDISDYDQSGYDYREYWRNRQYDNLIEQHTLQKLFPTFGERLIDIGGGFGRLMDTYKDRFNHITIFDYSRNNLQVAQARIESQHLHHITTQQGNIYELPFQDGTFDTALIVRVLHHLERPSLALHEIHRVMRPGGILIVQFSSKLHLKNRLKALFTRDKSLIDKKPINLSESGIFYQFHPEYVIEKLKENDFAIRSQLSIAHLRIPLLYRAVPAGLLAKIEQIFIFLFGRFLLGPSVFIVAEKR